MWFVVKYGTSVTRGAINLSEPTGKRQKKWAIYGVCYRTPFSMRMAFEMPGQTYDHKYNT